MNFFSIKAYSQNEKVEDIVKIGVYEYTPYIMVDSNGNISGYFSDLFKLIKEKYDFEYEYVLCSISEGLEKLKSGEIDIMPGISILANDTDIIYNEYSVNQEKFGIFSKEYDDLSDLKNMDIVRLGLVKDDYNSYWILKYFKVNKINIETVLAETYDELDNLLNKNKIDLMIDNICRKNTYNMIYRFAGNQIYIAGNKNSKPILDNIDKVIYDFGQAKDNEIKKLKNKYFETNNSKYSAEEIALFLILTIISLVSLMFWMIPRIKKKIIKDKIKYRMNNEHYLLQYQPIYNPRNKKIVGFEGLLRLRGENNKLIPPSKFIPEIEDNNMLFDMSIWIFEKAIKDYKEIEKFLCVKGRDFYISINISLNEIENDNFVKRFIEILSKSNLEDNRICLEVIERVKMNDINKITKNIGLLKNAGFKIAIDDFGVEYSNLDVIEKLDVDTIKVDKNFVDGICKDIIRSEIILFISKIASVKNRTVILEGVEESYQDTAIKNIDNNLLYVQGYYYNKPMYIEEIKYI